MDYIEDININEAVIHILDRNAENAILNEFKMEFTEDIYKFIFKHIQKCLKDEELKYAKFNNDRGVVKSIVKDYLEGKDNDILGLSKELAKQLFAIMTSNVSVPSCDLIVASIVTDKGPMIVILKMDYIKNFTHEVDMMDKKIGIDIVPQSAGLPGSGQKIQKAAFIKPISDKDTYNLMVIDKRKTNKDIETESDEEYFIKSFLGCSTIINERDMTKNFLKAAENWTRKNYSEDAVKAEEIRTTIKSKLKEDDIVNIPDLSEELFEGIPTKQEEFKEFLINEAKEKEIKVDRAWVDRKLKRVRLKVDKDIDLYIDSETYKNNKKFEIQRNGDGSINMIIKHVVNYIEK